jgi:NAD(P)-dependent dehydrogenase (short-subunit alcohol dehydrogenase family)
MTRVARNRSVDAGTLQGRVALVTGAGSGIGRAIAARLLEHGALVAIVERDRKAGRDARAELSAKGRVCFEPCDVADEAAVKRAVGKVARWGGGRLDIVVNNAADFAAFGKPVEKLQLALWRRTLDVNLGAAFLFAKHGARHLRKRRGCIVNITSTRACMSEPNTEAYAASKGGLSALTHALAISLGPEVRVNAIAPGWIATDEWKPRARRKRAKLSAEDHAQHPVGRVGRPEDVADCVLYLVSEAAGFVTGQVVTVDGGMTRKMIYAE